MKNEPEFLPCPFCGVPPTIIRQQFKYILLHECEAIKSNIRRGKINELAAKWNKRSNGDEL